MSLQTYQNQVKVFAINLYIYIFEIDKFFVFFNMFTPYLGALY